MLETVETKTGELTTTAGELLTRRYFGVPVWVVVLAVVGAWLVKSGRIGALSI